MFGIVGRWNEDYPYLTVVLNLRKLAGFIANIKLRYGANIVFIQKSVYALCNFMHTLNRSCLLPVAVYSKKIIADRPANGQSSMF